MSYVAWVLEASVNDREALDSVMNDLVAAVEANEPGTSHYEWNLADDGATLVNYERFVDSDAALAHLGGFGPFAERFMGALSISRFLVFGSPSDELREGLGMLNPSFAEQIGGFHR